MSRCRAYIDLDETLLTGIETVSGLIPRVRPDAGWFLHKMSEHCDLWLLTRADRVWAKEGLQAIGPASSVLRGIISREDILPIEEEIDVIMKGGFSEEEMRDLLGKIRPIAPAGVIFDDFPAWSWMYWIKSLAVGIGADQWIQVEEFSVNSPDRGGLRKAYLEFKRIFTARSTIGVLR